MNNLFIEKIKVIIYSKGSVTQTGILHWRPTFTFQKQGDVMTTRQHGRCVTNGYFLIDLFRFRSKVRSVSVGTSLLLAADSCSPASEQASPALPASCVCSSPTCMYVHHMTVSKSGYCLYSKWALLHLTGLFTCTC